MSLCITDTCPHGKTVFIWLGDGPGPDGRYPWVHSTTVSPGHLEVCGLMPPATAEEAGEECQCGHESREHSWYDLRLHTGAIKRAEACSGCGCERFRHRPEDLERWRLDGAA